MYEKHFGLQRRPFRALATGADVFVGPQTAKIMQATKLALATPDAVITVMGPPGTGKTTIVNRALETIDGDKLIIRIARMQLGHDEVLDFMLDEMQAQDVPASTIRKVTMCRRLLAELTASGKRVIVVLEDALRIGDDALAEIEALTAADGVGNEGAALVIMGEMELRERLDVAALTRLKQRVRAYQFVNPLAAPELQGYLKHCFRLGGGEFDLVFDAQAAAFIHALTGGIPRTANNVVEAVLNAAAARKLSRVDNRFVAAVAQSEFGLSAPLPEPVAPAAQKPAAPAAPGAAKMAGTAASSPQPGKTRPKTAQAAAPSPAGEAAPAKAEPAAAAPAAEPPQAAADLPSRSETTTPDTPADEAIPELIQDTLPNLEVLSPEDLDDEGEPAADEAPAAANERAEEDSLPTLASTGMEAAPASGMSATGAAEAPASKPDTAAEANPGAEPVAASAPEPAPELALEESSAAPVTSEAPAAQAEAVRDPTLAQLKPDFDALDEALAGLADDSEPAPEPPAPVVEEEEVSDATMPSLPKITLDAAIQENIAEATAALEKHDATIADDTLSEESSDIAAAAPKKPDPGAISDTDIQKIASGIRKAKSLEDVDEKMAETLFGAEFSAVAAQVIANPPPLDAASQPQLEESQAAPAAVPDEEQLIEELSLVEDSFASDPKKNAPARGSTPLDKPASDMEKEFVDVHGGNPQPASAASGRPNPGMDLSASQRLATVRALNAANAPKAASPPKAAPQGQPGPSSPDSIEDQITTSMTATLKALSARPDSANDADDDEGDTPKRGFFSRFKRS